LKYRIASRYFERIDFVFLESYLPVVQEEILPGIPQKLFRHKLRPLAHTVQRRSPTALDLRLLRRFTWIEADGFFQQEKIVHAYGVVYWSEQFFNNRALFSDYYLLHRFRERAEWEDDPKPVFRELRQLYRDAASRTASKEIQDRKSLLSGFIAPVLSTLGFTFEPGSRGPGRPRLQGEPENLPLYAPGGDTLLARCLLYAWGRALDRKDAVFCFYMKELMVVGFSVSLRDIGILMIKCSGIPWEGKALSALLLGDNI
jgi:hypothetical protein